jgi:hypothetical protein
MTKVAKPLPGESGVEEENGGKQSDSGAEGGKNPQSRIRSRSLSEQEHAGVESGGGGEGNVKKPV